MPQGEPTLAVSVTRGYSIRVAGVAFPPCSELFAYLLVDAVSGLNNFIKNSIRSLIDSLLNNAWRPVFFLSLFFLRRRMRRSIELRQCDWPMPLKVDCPWKKRVDGLPGW